MKLTSILLHMLTSNVFSMEMDRLLRLSGNIFSAFWGDLCGLNEFYANHSKKPPLVINNFFVFLADSILCGQSG